MGAKKLNTHAHNHKDTFKETDPSVKRSGRANVIDTSSLQSYCLTEQSDWCMVRLGSLNGGFGEQILVRRGSSLNSALQMISNLCLGLFLSRRSRSGFLLEPGRVLCCIMVTAPFSPFVDRARVPSQHLGGERNADSLAIALDSVVWVSEQGASVEQRGWLWLLHGKFIARFGVECGVGVGNPIVQYLEFDVSCIGFVPESPTRGSFSDALPVRRDRLFGGADQERVSETLEDVGWDGGGVFDDGSVGVELLTAATACGRGGEDLGVGVKLMQKVGGEETLTHVLEEDVFGWEGFAF